jgi:hypothetical protein
MYGNDMIQPIHSDVLKHLLMDMISSSRAVAAPRFANLCEPDWTALSIMASQHRLEPILHNYHRTIGADWPVPESVKDRWHSAYRRSAMKALEVRRTLIRVTKLLDQAHIRYAALKGSWLMNNAYSDPALRPMRDIDILVEAQDAVAAFERLESFDFQRADDDTYPLDYYLENFRDMPELYEKRTGIKLEMHFRVTDAKNLKVNSPLSNSKALLENRTGGLSDKLGISYLSPTSGLLHLVVHAAYDHKFNNGPLILHDVARFVENAEVDWKQFWSMADAGDWRSGCDLVFALTSYYHAESRDYLPHAEVEKIPDEVLNAASLLMLQDFHQRAVVDLRTELAVMDSLLARLRALGRRAVPSRLYLGQFVGLAQDSKLFWLGYPFWLAVRARQYLFRKLAPGLRRDVQNAVVVGRWLNR